MLSFQINKIFPLGTDCCNKFDGIAYDGCYFYFTSSHCCEIHKYDKCFNYKEHYCVCRGYTSICYDKYYNCFWAVSNKPQNRIFKLNICFKEIDCIDIKCDGLYLGCITGISPDATNCNKLIISSDNYIAAIRKTHNPTLCIIQQGSCFLQFTSIQSLKDMYIVTNIKNSCVGLCGYNECNELKFKCCLPDEFSIEDMTAVYVQNCDIGFFPMIYILVTKNKCYPYLMKCSLLCCEESKSDCCDDVIYSPSFGLNCDSPEDCSKSCNNIIESVALIETSLSHILNAEGEKIQNILQTARKPCEIIEVNDSVNKTITNITHLEHILFSKLQLAKDLCPPSKCDCDNKHKK